MPIVPTPERARRWRIAAALLSMLAADDTRAGMQRMAAPHPEVAQARPHEHEPVPKAGEQQVSVKVEAPVLRPQVRRALPSRTWNRAHLAPVGEPHACCKFMVAKVETPALRTAKLNAKTHFFDAKIDMAKVKIITATADSVALRTIGTLPKERRLDAREWKTLDDARSEFRKHVAAVGAGGVMILLAHNEGGGRMQFKGHAGDGELRSPELVKVAKEEGVDLLVWGCQSAGEVSGGAIQAFPLKPMVVALRDAFKIADPTWGVLLNAITAATGIEFAFDPATLAEPGGFAAKLVSSEQSRSPEFDLPGLLDVLPSVSFPNQRIIQALGQDNAPAAVAPPQEPDSSDDWREAALISGFGIAAGALLLYLKRRAPSLSA